jgi:hypothetical protein
MRTVWRQPPVRRQHRRARRGGRGAVESGLRPAKARAITEMRTESSWRVFGGLDHLVRRETRVGEAPRRGH